jgi:SAM-dependent methyltransferase
MAAVGPTDDADRRSSQPQKPLGRVRGATRVTAMASGAEEFKAFEAAGWSRRADTYARVTGAITARFVDALLDAACVGVGMRVLDVATGPGHVAAAAAARGAEPVGVDIAEGMLAVARRDHPQLDFRHGDAEALPFADSSFDAVVGAFVLNHLPRPEVSAAELARAEHGVVEALGPVKVARHPLVPRQRRVLVDELGARVGLRLPDAEHRALGVRRHEHPTLAHNVERAVHDGAARVGARRGDVAWPDSYHPFSFAAYDDAVRILVVDDGARRDRRAVPGAARLSPTDALRSV